MKTDKQRQIQQLEKLAAEVLILKQERNLRRPLLIEFCGSPKSGKSTTINALNIFLKRNDFKTVVLTERASVCPIKNKTDPSFNIWTLTSAIAEILKNLEFGGGAIDIIISDRGIFDALCWFEWLNKNPNDKNKHLDDVSYKQLEDFILMDIWQSSLDLIYIFKVRPETSIEREYANLLTEKRGSIMDEPKLLSFNNAIDSVITKHGDKFRDVKKIETDTEDTNNNPDKVSYDVTAEVLHYLQDLLIEKIGYFDDSVKANLPFGISDTKKILAKKLKFNNRDKVESKKQIQPIPIAVITDPSRKKVLVVKKSAKRTSTKSPERDKLSLWVGGHVRLEDKKTESTFDTFERTLRREIKEELGESLSVLGIDPFIIYTPNNEVSERHVAVCYVIEMDLEGRKFKLTSDEFIMKTGTTNSGHVIEIKDLVSGNDKIEDWSVEILKSVFKAELSRKLDLFEA